MKKNWKKGLIAFVTMMLLLIPVLGACGNGSSDNEGSAKSGEKVSIGVLIYDPSDSQVLAFQKYYNDYIAKNYNVEFKFSDAISTAEEEKSAIENFASQNCKAVIALTQSDMVAAINESAKAKMYYIVGVGTMTDEQYEETKDNEYFLGTIGPDLASEEKAGYDMAKHYIAEGNTNFVLYAGGMSYGVDAHRKRFEGFVKAFQEAGVTYKKPESGKFIGEFESDKYTIQVLEGFPDDAGAFYTEAQQKLGEEGVQTLLSVGIGLEVFGATISNVNPEIKLATVSAFTEAYKDGFNANPQQIDYLSGTFPAMIGPTFAAVMNAVNGDSKDFREDGQAFRITQNYWNAQSKDEFDTMYEIANDFKEPAINKADLDKLIKKNNEDITYKEFKEFASNVDFETIQQNISERE
ncbi:hypothetical protein [Enterococcus sp.]|uniref:sugar ABC transporter substrate-binding protein n=1 Tax=Enterococcus sp. TaxID=35783 RepID=UPI00290CDDBF|nr:hypothetical protein [Enterococcus sp.]MDU5336560.1 hypothetical protein [Enterococcus sp.]